MPSSSGPLRTKSYAFALSIVNLYRLLVQKREYVIAKQILKSGTSIGANAEEAVYAQSKNDFIHKLSISIKEANETYFWLRLLRDSGIVPAERIQPLERDVQELLKILTAIINSSKTSLKKLSNYSLFTDSLLPHPPALFFTRFLPPTPTSFDIRSA